MINMLRIINKISKRNSKLKGSLKAFTRYSNTRIEMHESLFQNAEAQGSLSQDQQIVES